MFTAPPTCSLRTSSPGLLTRTSLFISVMDLCHLTSNFYFLQSINVLFNLSVSISVFLTGCIQSVCCLTCQLQSVYCLLLEVEINQCIVLLVSYNQLLFYRLDSLHYQTRLEVGEWMAIVLSIVAFIAAFIQTGVSVPFMLIVLLLRGSDLRRSA